MRLPLFRIFSSVVTLCVAVCAFADSPTERATVLLDQGEFLAAERLIEPLALAKKPDPVAVWAMSRVRTAQHQTQEGIKLAEKAIKLDPSQARFHAQLGAAIMAHLGEVERLEQGALVNRLRKAYEKALELDPNNLVALLGLSRYYWSPPTRTAKDMETAKGLAERAQKIDPFKGTVELGAICMRKADVANALKYFEAASDLKPTDVDTHIACGNLLARLGRRTDARERYETALRLAPKSEGAKRALEALDAPPPPARKP